MKKVYILFDPVVNMTTFFLLLMFGSLMNCFVCNQEKARCRQQWTKHTPEYARGRAETVAKSEAKQNKGHEWEASPQALLEVLKALFFMVFEINSWSNIDSYNTSPIQCQLHDIYNEFSLLEIRFTRVFFVICEITGLDINM